MTIELIRALVKAGRFSSGVHGTHGDHGHLAHAVIGEPGGTEKALCGTRPGIAASWSAEVAAEVTCPKCIKKMDAIAKKENPYSSHEPVSARQTL